MQAEAVLLKDVFPYLRRRFTFLRRSIYAAAAAFMVFSAIGGTRGLTPREAAAAGATVFDLIMWLILVAGIFECTFGGATSISTERERKTVEIWVLAGMEHVGMVFSKAFSVLTRAASTLIAPAVPASVAVFMGGRSVRDAQGCFLAIASILFVVTALSVAVSSTSEKNSSSIPVTFITVLGFAVVPYAVLAIVASGGGLAAGMLKLHPFTILGEIGREKAAGFLSTAFASLALSAALSSLLLLAAGLSLKKARTSGLAKKRDPKARLDLDRLLAMAAPRIYHFFKPRPGNVDEQPVLWRERTALANRRGTVGSMSVTDKILLAILGAVAIYYVFIVSGSNPRTVGSTWGVGRDVLIILVLLAGLAISFLYQASFAVKVSQAFSREFQARDMALLRLTCLDGDAIVSGKMRAYLRHYSPVAFMACVWGVALWAASWLVYMSENVPSDVTRFVSGFLMQPFGWATAGFAMTAIALLSSLYCRTGARALYTTMVISFVIPIVSFLVLSVFSFGFLLLPLPLRLGIGVPVALSVYYAVWAWSRRYEKSRFYSKHECLVLAIFAVAVIPRFAGVVLGSVGIYYLVSALMRMEFDSFLTDEPTFFDGTAGAAGGRPSGRGSWALTYLGIPPGIEKRLTKALDRTANRPTAAGAPPNGAAPMPDHRPARRP